jgi:hypothetical protein
MRACGPNEVVPGARPRICLARGRHRHLFMITTHNPFKQKLRIGLPQFADALAGRWVQPATASA